MKTTYTQEIFDELEAAGIVRKNGQMRPDRDGKMQPVYVITELGRQLHDLERLIPSTATEGEAND
jgi:hypothetical protein